MTENNCTRNWAYMNMMTENGQSRRLVR